MDKYFHPFAKGLEIKLFVLDEETFECAKTISSILSTPSK
jgi:hypothetical protein